jgi:uncharacterized protein (DUF983 family)
MAGMTSDTVAPAKVALPASIWQAMKRGALSRCPRCDGAPLFRKWLKSVDACAACQQDWTPHRADDLPAYIAILVTGHLLAPILIALTLELDLSPPVILALTIPPAVALMLGMLQPSKGAVIAVQWWHGLHGFVKERAEPVTAP